MGADNTFEEISFNPDMKRIKIEAPFLGGFPPNRPTLFRGWDKKGTQYLLRRSAMGGWERPSGEPLDIMLEYWAPYGNSIAIDTETVPTVTGTSVPRNCIVGETPRLTTGGLSEAFLNYCNQDVNNFLNDPFNKQNKQLMNETFFMNFAQGGGAPTMTFTTQDAALAEAKRLVGVTRKKVFTLKAVAVSALPEEVIVVQSLEKKTARKKTKKRSRK